LDLGETFCSTSNICPLDGLFAIKNYNSNSTPAVDSKTYQTSVAFNQYWNFYLQSQANHSHMSELYISLSPPCYNSEYQYVQRSYPISEVYDSGECPGDGINGIKIHQGYVSSGFKESEKDVLNENGILSGVMSKVPNYQDSDLTANFFELYYKPFSMWSPVC
jgi:hypothetical protein